MQIPPSTSIRSRPVSYKSLPFHQRITTQYDVTYSDSPTVIIYPPSCHEGLRGSGGIAPRILNLDNGWRWAVYFLRLVARANGTDWVGQRVSHRADLRTAEKCFVNRKSITIPWSSNPLPSHHKTEISQIFHYKSNICTPPTFLPGAQKCSYV